MFLLLLYFVVEVLTNFIIPDKPNPIVPYRNNQNAYSQYDIYLSFRTMITKNGELEIIFPDEYDSTKIVLLKDNVMIADSISNDACPIQVTFSTTTTCATNYILSNRKLTIYFGQTALNAGSYKIRIKYNQNPADLGGKSTGYFQVNTKNSGVLVDSNINFGTIGFATAYISHSTAAEAQIQNDGSNLGGYVTNYVIVFTTTKDLAINSWFRAEIATGFDISGITCVLVDTQQDLKCTIENQRIYFGAITAALSKGQHKIKLKQVINPSFSGNTDHFVFETMEPDVNTVIEYYFIDPVYIKPGQIINPSIAGSPLNKNLRIDYTVKFTPMNKIPAPGMIEYTFPAEYKLDPNCRIISGLTEISGSSISCVTSGTKITITNFADFSPQEITLKIYATNPPTSKLYTPCTIQTYSKFSGTTYKPIDQNLDAGSIQISEIESPYFVAIDLYRYMVNSTLDQLGPLDFELYPMPTKQLKLTTSTTSYGEIFIQIPLWWRLQNQQFNGWDVIGATPTCNFGAEVSELCTYYLQIFKFRTPKATNYLKYYANQGLGQCDLPISLANVRLTPIPGRWDFRVLTFNDGSYSTFDQIPLEQDLYTMEIAVDPFPATTYVKCTSKDQVDQHTVCYSQLRVGLPIPYEGAINFNMSTVNSTYDSSAAWPNDLGFGIGNDAYLQIPCTVIINGQTVGYAGTIHPNVVCYAFSGGLTRKYSILQVRGFSSVLGSGSVVFVVIPDIKSCTAYDLQCYITLSSAYTTELDDPYTLNILKTSIALIVQGSVSKDVSVNAPANANQLQDTTLQATFANFIEICKTTTWTFKFTSPTNIQANRDHLLIKMPRDRFPYSRTGATSSAGTVYLVDNFRFNQLYYFIIVTNNVASGTPTQVTLSNVRNAIEYTPGVDTFLVYWVDQRRQRVISFPTSPTWTDGGILDPQFQILPKTTWFPANRLEASDMDFDSWVIFQVQFQTCHVVNSGGLIELQVQSGLQTSTSTCEVWEGVSSAPKGLGYTHQCNLVTVSGNQYYHITLFDPVPTLTNIKLSYRGKTVTAATTMNPITINTYFNSATRISSPSDAANVNDFYNTVLNGVLNGVAVTGPKIFPTKLEWQPFIDYEQLAREGTRGEFYMHIKSTYNIPSYTSNSAPRLIFTFDTQGINYPGGNAQPHCRINGQLCRICTWGGSAITMSMPLNIGMTAEVDTLVSISTRGADGSATVDEGLNHVKAGRYKMKIETLNTGSAVEFTYKLIDIPAPKLRAFWVWSSNKIGFDPNTPQDPLANMACYRIFFNNPTYIPPSNNPNPVKMTVRFYRTIWPTFTNGFEGDLGTGKAHRSELPCIPINFNILSTAEKLKCRLFIGSYPNPAQVIITDFDAIPAGTNGEIHLPYLFNPNSTYELTKVGLVVELTDTLTGNSQTLLENEYSLINGTFGRTKEQPAFNQISIDVVKVNRGQLQTQWPAAVNPTFAVDTIDTMTTFSVQFGCKDHQMGGGADMILFEMPPTWELPTGLIGCSFPATCYGYPGGPYVGAYLDTQITANTLTTGTINMKTPPFKIITATSDPPIKIYVFTRSKLVDYWEILFTQVMQAISVTPAVTCDNCFFKKITDYVITVTNPKNIPSNGAIEIKYPTGLIPRENGCRNSLSEGSELSQTGLVCIYDGTNKAFVITGFTKFIGPGKIVIRIRMENPAAASDISGTWGFNTWYLYETPFNKLITYGTASNPTLSDYTDIPYWDTPYRSRTRARTTQYGVFEFRIKLDLTAGSPLYIKLPFNKVRCSQFLCIWDSTPWYDNHDDNFLTAEKCLYDSATSVLSMYTPKGKTIAIADTWRIIIDTMNGYDGIRGFQMPTTAVYQFELYTTSSKAIKKYLVPQLKDFNFFECYSLVTNVGLKNMFSVQFDPQTNIPADGYMILYIPTQSEEGAFLFDNDLLTGKNDGDQINCYGRTGFSAAANTGLKCYLKWGERIQGIPVQIKITGFAEILNSGTRYALEIDEFKNPTVTGDDKHIEIRFESYNNANTLLDQGYSYDFTLKQYTPTQYTLAAPTPSVFTLFATSATFDFVIKANSGLDSNEPYDYYVFEFPKPEYGAQPHTLLTKKGAATWSSRVSQGHNWVIIKPSIAISSSATTLQFTNYNNPQQLPSSGIKCVGYAVKDRIVMDYYEYTLITSFLPNAVSSTDSSFLIEPMDYDITKIPINTMLKLKITITIPSTSDTIPDTAYFDMYAPTGFSVYENCENYVGSEMTFTKTDNLLCTTTTGTLSSTTLGNFVGRPQLTYSGMDSMVAGKKQIFIIYAKTCSSALAIASANWNLIVWTDSTRTTSLFSGAVAPFAVQSYGTFKEVNWIVKKPMTIRQSSIAPFEFSISLKTAASSSTQLTITFPNSVSLPSNAVMFCTITIESTGIEYAFSYCYGSGTFTVTLLFPVSPTTFAANTWYKISINSRGSNTDYGLQFSTSGKFTAALAMGGDSGSLEYEILPTPQFSTPIFKIVNQLQNQLTAFLFKFTTTVLIPKTGFIVIEFPNQSVDGSVQYFDQYLSGTANNNGDTFNCYSSTLAIKVNSLDCRIYRSRGLAAITSIVIQTFPADVPVSTTIELAIEDIKMIYATTNGNIPIALYTTDKDKNKLEAIVFYDWVSPVSTSDLTMSSMSPSLTVGNNNVQDAASTFTFSSVNIGTKPITPYSHIFFRFPPNDYDLTGLTLTTGTTAACLSSASVITIANYAIYTQSIQPATTCSGSGKSFKFSGSRNAYSRVANPFKIFICQYRACTYQGSATPTIPAAVAPASATGSSISNTLVFPYAYVSIDAVYTMNYDLPAGSQIVIWHPTTQFTGEQVLLTDGGITSVQTQKKVNGANTEYWVTLNSFYSRSTNTLKFTIIGRLPGSIALSPTVLYKIGFYTRYKNVEVTSDTGFSFFTFTPPATYTTALDYSSLTKGKLTMINAIPGVMSQNNAIYIRIPGYTGSLVYKLDIYIDAVQISGGSCTVQWIQTTLPGTPVPTCQSSSVGLITISQIPLEGVADVFLIKVSNFKFTSYGMKQATVIFYEDNMGTITAKGIYYGQLPIYQYGTTTSTSYVSHTINSYQNNHIGITFQTTSLDSQTPNVGEFFLDILDNISSPTSKKVLCQMNTEATCKLVISHPLSSTTTVADGYDDNLFNRIRVTNFDTITSGISVQFDIWFQETYTNIDCETKFFNFGYYKKQGANSYDYYFGKNFFVTIKEITTAIPSQTLTLNLAGTVQSQQTLSTSTFTTTTSITSGDILYVKLLNGYIMAPTTVNAEKNLQSYQIKIGSSASSAKTYIGISEQVIGAVSSPYTINFNSLEMPYLPSASITGSIAQAMILDSSRNVKEVININKAGTVNAATLTGCSAKQLDKNTFQVQFQLPTNFIAFNNYDCTPSTCRQAIKISSTSSLSDVTTYDILCGSSAITYQQTPTIDAPMYLETSSTYFRLRGFRYLDSSASICVGFRKSGTFSGSISLTIAIVDIDGGTETVLGSCSTSVTAGSTGPSGALQGVIKSQFGYNDYIDAYSGIEKNAVSELVFQMAFSAAATTNGYIQIATDSMDLANFDQKKRLKCMFRKRSDQLVFFSPLECTVDATNLLFKVDYHPQTANRIPANTLVELVIKYDQQTDFYLNIPAASGDKKFLFDYKNDANAIQLSAVVIAPIFDKQSNKVIAQTFFDHSGSFNDFYLSFTAQTSIPTDASIQLEFPLNQLTDTATLSNLQIKDLGTSISNGYKINCVDKGSNLGTTYKCNIYYGIDSQSQYYTSIRMTGFSGISSGTLVKIAFMKFKNPSTNLLMDFRVRIYSPTANYEYTVIRAAHYTIPSLSLSSSTSGSISVTPLTAGSAITYTYTISNPGPITKITQGGICLEYNQEMWGKDYSAFTATVNSAAADIYPMDQKTVYIMFPSDYSASTSLQIKITAGLANPKYSGSITQNLKAYFFDYQTKKSTYYRTASTTTAITGSTIVTMGTVSCSSSLQNDPLNVMKIMFTTSSQLDVDNVIQLTLTGYTFTAGDYCALYDETASKALQVTCTVSSATVIKLLLKEKLVTGGSFSMRLQVKTPSASGASSYTADFYADSAATLNMQSTTASACTISSYSAMFCAMPYVKTPQVLLQDGEIGPLTLTVKLTAAITTFNSYVQIDDSWIGKSIATPDDTKRYEFACFFNNDAAFTCNHLRTQLTKIKAVIPKTNGIQADTLVTLRIYFWREKPIGEVGFKYSWHDTTTDQIVTANIKDIPLKFYSPSNAVTATVTETIAWQNFRFSENNVAFINRIAVHQGTIDTYTALTVSFKLKRALKSNLGVDWGQLILRIPTMDDWDNTQPQFPDGLGRYTLNNQEIDCLCSSCPSTYSTFNPLDPIAPIFKCYSYLGAQHKAAPVEIWINPQTNLAADQEFEITIAKVKLPPTQYTYSKFSLIAYEYYQTTNKYINHTEIVHDFTFSTIPDTYPSVSGVAHPTFTPNLVGEPATMDWVINNAYQDMLGKCHDRWVLSTDDANMIFEHPYNPKTGTLYSNGGVAPYNYILFTTATNHKVMIFKLAKWATFQPTVDQTKSSTQTLSVQKFKNMPYQIPTGVNYKMELFIDVGVRQHTNYATFSTSPVNTLVIDDVAPVAPPCLTLQPQTYELKFLPYNKIPKKGKIIFILPNYGWTYSDAYCKVSQNLVDSGCDIISTSREIIIKDWLNDYDPNIQGQITVTFDIINPPTAQTTIPFDWKTYWDSSQTWLIDTKPLFDPVNTIMAGGNLRVTLWNRYQSPYTICGGRTGPLRLRFTLRTGNLVYPNDYIKLDMWYAFTPSMPTDRIVCYFNDPADPVLVKIKSHRCDWTTGGGGSLVIYVPEEIDLKVGHEWELVISTFASLGRDGWTIRSPSDLYWVTFSTSSTNDKGWFEAQIPGCPFDNNRFNCENVGWQASDPAGDPSWTIFNFTAQTLYNNIPTGDPSVSGHSRIRFDFITHNELDKSWPKDLTNRMSATDERAQVACNGLIKGNTKPLQAQGNQYIECWNIKASNDIWNNTPSYILGQYYEQIAASQLFHFQLADFRNGYVVGAFQHIKISIDVKQEDGTFYPQNEHYCWHVPSALQAIPSPTTGTSSWSPQRTQVDLTQIRTNFQASIPSTLNIGDVVVYDFNYPYTLPVRGYCLQQSVNANFSDAPEAPCTPQHYNHWLVFGNVLPKTSWYVQERNYLFNPPFVFEHSNPLNPTLPNTLTAKSKLRVYVWRNHLLIYNNSLPDITPTTGRAYVVLQTTKAENPSNQYVKYHLGIFLQTYTKWMKYIRIWAPQDFQDIKDCKVNRGLTLKDQTNLAAAITCTITQITTPITGWLIEVNNYSPYQGDGWMILDFNIKNPNAQKWAGTWYVRTYESNTNMTYVIDEAKQQGAQMWVGETILPPNLFRVFRNTISFENRRAQTDDYAEVHMRILPRYSHPATTSTSNTQIQIWLPITYDLANGGTALCDVSNKYHTDLDAVNCEISADRKITISTDNTYGLKSECSMVSVTTENAIGGNGIKLPSTPQQDTFQVFLDSTDASGAIKREYNYNSAYAAPDPITSSTDSTFSITSTIRECNQNTVIKVRFTAPLNLPAGYSTATDTIDPLSAPPIGTIKVKFNTQDKVNNGFAGFPVNLGFTTTTDVKCQGFGAVTGTLKCTLTSAPMVSVDYPAIIEVKGFDYIKLGQLVEIHFLDIKNGCQYSNDGNIKVSAYQTNGDSTKTELIKDSVGYVPIYNSYYYGNYYYTVYTTCPVSTDVTITPNQVGAYMKMTIQNLNINCTTSAYTTLTTGDEVVLQFPNYFEFPAESNGALSAVWNDVQMTTIVYPLNKEVYLTFPPGTPTQSLCANTLILSQLRGPAYAFTSAYSISLKIIRKGYRRVECSITGLPAPSVAPPSTASFTISSQFAGDVFVDYKFSFSPSYTIPAGSSIMIKLPNNGLLNYNHIASSSPSAVCSATATLVSSCSISSTYLTVTALKEISAQTPLYISLTGAKNPSYVGLTSATDYQLIINHPNGFTINSQNFDPFTFYAQKVVGVIYMKMSNTNSFQTVTAAYTFVLQNSNQLPASGLIMLRMPKEWASVVTPQFTIAKLTASWTSESLSYSSTVVQDTDFYNLKISNQFVWPQGTSITILMLKLVNPSFEWTKIFQAMTQYDGVTLDQTDPLDSSLRFQFKAAVPAMTVSNFTMEPSNSGEISTYKMTMTSVNNMTAGSSIQMQFPSTYPPGLTSYDISLGCLITFSNGTVTTVPCSAENQKLTLTLSSEIAKNTTFSVSIVGITNPNQDTSSSAVKGTIDVLTADSSNNILTYTSNAAEINPSAAPQTMKLLSVSTDSTNLQVKANYTVCIQTDQPIPLGAQVFVDFPNQFTLRSSSYDCYISEQHNNTLLPYDNTTTSPGCLNTNSLRRIAVLNHTKAYAGDASNPVTMCYIIKNIENPTSPGPIDNFVMSVYDPSTKNVLYGTFGTLSAAQQLTYSQQGLVITVDTIDPIARYLSSPLIKVTLERSVSHTVTLVPQSDEFKFSPAELVFLPANGPIMYFKIQAINDETTPVGQKQFSWSKTESSTAKFSEMPDSFFKYIDTPIANSLSMTISPKVFRVALGATSLPITLTLSQPASEDLTVTYKTVNPSQDDYLSFNTSTVVFPAGTTTQQLTYTTSSGALSGSIAFTIEGKYNTLYTVNDNIVNFEILQQDDKIPTVVNYYAVNTQRTSMYFRASIDESVTLYYYLTLKGTPKPTMDQILNKTNISSVFYQFGNNQSYMSSVTTSYIYNDVFLDFQGLTEQTDYTLYFYVTDLAGNNNTEVKTFNFTTLEKYQPAQFSLTLSSDVDIEKLLSALGLITGLSSSAFSIISSPSKYTIPGTENDTDVQNILSNLNTTYTIQINPDATTGGLSPYQYIQLLQSNTDLLKQEIPEFIEGQNLLHTAKTIFEYPQEFKYAKLLNVTEQSASFKVALRYTGILYTILLPADEPIPTSKQISMGLNSTNQIVKNEWKYVVRFKYSNKTSTDDQDLSTEFTYTLLFDNTQYTAYMTGDNDLLNPDLIQDSKIKIISFKTNREIVIIPTYYIYGSLIQVIVILLWIN